MTPALSNPVCTIFTRETMAAAPGDLLIGNPSRFDLAIDFAHDLVKFHHDKAEAAVRAFRAEMDADSFEETQCDFGKWER